MVLLCSEQQVKSYMRFSTVFYIRVRVNNEKNEGVKKAPQAHGGGPLWSFRKYDPLVIRFHPLVKYEINVQRWPFRGGLCYLNFRTLSQK